MKSRLTPKKITAAVTILLAVCALIFSGGYILSLNREITTAFNGQRWAVPAVVYARPLELYPGMELSPAMLEKEILLAGYRRETPVTSQGGYYRSGGDIELVSRDFSFASGQEPSIRAKVSFDGNTVTAITDLMNQAPLSHLRLDPARIGSFHPLQHEDRLVLNNHQIPKLLQKGLIAVEDKNFTSHFGISPLGIARALAANLKAGKTIQGGSTLTQQLVKNYFLSSERTLSRKFKEAIMAFLLELQFSKEEILTAYINEVFLGQDRNRAVHGFGLAAQFYFRRNLADLSVGQTATLIGMVKGPSYYDPRKHEERCIKRRQTVLEVMLAQGVITRQMHERASAEPLSDVSPQQNGFNRFPAFLDLVRRQLLEEYQEDDLKTNGLRILTTLDPQVQWQVESGLQQTIPALERDDRTGNLEGAVLVTGRDNGEIQALAGSRAPLGNGFNRALRARRPVGSMIKPAVYLTALGSGYTLASPLSDTALSVTVGDTTWSPENFDRTEHGQTALYQALARSYNLATVRLGMELGLEPVIATINGLGYTGEVAPYPSLLLGSLEMTPLELTGMYQTIASGGFHMPLRSINGVLDADGQVLTRYGLEVEQRFPPETIYLLTHALERVMTEGTGSRIAGAARFYSAGKTGTSDSQRDSWYAGLTSDRLCVVWLGRDDNQPTSLTGSSGALRAWVAIMSPMAGDTAMQAEPPGITWTRIDTDTLQPATVLNSRSTKLPFLAGTEPDGTGSAPPSEAIGKGIQEFIDSINRIFD